MLQHTTEQTTQQTVCMGNWHHAIIIMMITNHHIQAPSLSRHNVSYNINKTREQPVQLTSSLVLYLQCLHVRFKLDVALKQFFSKFFCSFLLITIIPLLLLLLLPPEMCTDLTRQHVTRFWVFKLRTSLHLLVSQDAGPCADYDKYYSQIFPLVPSDFDKLILATLLQGNISVLTL